MTVQRCCHSLARWEAHPARSATDHNPRMYPRRLSACALIASHAEDGKRKFKLSPGRVKSSVRSFFFRRHHRSMSGTVHVGLVGCSWFAQHAHLPALLELEGGGGRGFRVRLVAVCSRTRKSMARAEATMGRALRRHARMEDLMADEEIDVVLLVLPIPLMARAIQLALRANKHVISEKPIASSFEQTLELLHLYRALPCPAPIWAVSENWVNKPSVVILRRMIVTERAIGPILGARVDHHEEGPAPRGWKDSWRSHSQHEVCLTRCP